jgi:hypothetical protein
VVAQVSRVEAVLQVVVVHFPVDVVAAALSAVELFLHFVGKVDEDAPCRHVNVKHMLLTIL